MLVGGTIRVPGDKSLSHRALLFAAMARGTSHIGGMLTSLDARSSARVLRQLGAEITPLGDGKVVTVRGRGRLRRPSAVLHCGNSGTTTRLILGLLAAHPFRATLTGDRSLRRRPMRRVTVPLARMGAAGLERVPQFSWQNITAKVDDYYHFVARRAAAHGPLPAHVNPRIVGEPVSITQLRAAR